MVGQNVLKTGTLDIKPPTTSFLPRGFRFQPWKTFTVELIITDGGPPELRTYSQKENSLRDVYILEDINDITLCGSKTHAHAFEIISGTKPLVIMSGTSEMDSRNWIWTLRNLLWPNILVEPDDGANKLQLVPNQDSDRLRLPSGVFDVSVSVVCIAVQLLFKCSSDDSRQTPVEPFSGQSSKESMTIPLTTIGQFRIEMEKTTPCFIIELSTESEYGKTTLVFKKADENGSDIERIMDNVKNVIFRATNNLHDCISNTKWRLT